MEVQPGNVASQRATIVTRKGDKVKIHPGSVNADLQASGACLDGGHGATRDAGCGRASLADLRCAWLSSHVTSVASPSVAFTAIASPPVAGTPPRPRGPLPRPGAAAAGGAR